MYRKEMVIQSQGLSVEEIHVSRTLDVRGQVCPYPSLETVRALAPLKTGEVLEVLTDNEISALDSIPTVSRRRSLPYLVLKDEGYWRVYVKK